MKNEDLRKQYDRYMIVVDIAIKETKSRMESLAENERVSKMSFEEWCEWQNK